MFLIGLSAFVAGFVQSVTGFGAGIVVMMVLPYFYSLSAASAVNSSMTILLNLSLAVQFRKSIKWQKVIWPSIISSVSTVAAIQLYNYLPIRIMKIIFAAFLCILAVYFLAFKNVKLKDNPLTMIICSLLSGFGNGLFGIGGPPMVLYILAVTDEKEEYIGTLQTIFFLNGLFSVSSKWLSGYVGKELLLPIIVGIGLIIVGEKIGTLFLNKISGEKMKKYIYILMAVTAFIQLVQCF